MNDPADSLSITLRKGSVWKDEFVAGVYCGLHVVQPGIQRPLLVPFAPHRNHPASEITATVHRYACKMPRYDGDEMNEFTRFYRQFIPMAFTPLCDDEVPGFSKWLSETSYPGSRKKSLQELRASITDFRETYLRVMSFIKDEFYASPKNARAINSYSDESKTLLGALLHAMDKKTFATKWFVKGTNPRDWPSKLEDIFSGDPVVTTDFSSFEAHHHDGLARVAYFWAMHMSRGLTKVKALRDMIALMMLGVNEITFRHTRVEVKQRLMSGAMWTSSANGVLNLCLMAYMSAKSQNIPPHDRARWAVEEFRCLVEGDDGLTAEYHIRPELPQRLGLRLKPVSSHDYSTAGFCSIYCARQSRVVIKDPIEALRKMFVLSSRYKDFSEKKKRALLRVKAMSYMSIFPSCPIIA